MGTLRRFRVVTGLKFSDFAGIATGAPNILKKMKDNAATFTAPNPSMQVLEVQVNDFLDAHQLVIHAGARGASAAREVKRNTLWTSLGSERQYVEALCNESPENAANYAALAGMRLSADANRVQEVLKVQFTPTPGTLFLKAAASLLEGPGKSPHMQRTYFWRYQVNGAGSYVMIEPTPVSHTLVTGLPPASLISFEVAVKDAKGMSAWSQALVVQIH